jgi:hypothetical protein
MNIPKKKLQSELNESDLEEEEKEEIPIPSCLVDPIVEEKEKMDHKN